MKTLLTAILLTSLPAFATDFTPADIKLLAGHTLTTELMEKTFASALEWTRLRATDAELDRELSQGQQQTSVEQGIRRLETLPRTGAILRAHKLSARDYALTNLAINLAMAPIWKVPAASRPKGWDSDPTLAATTPQHLQFVEAHQAEIQKYRADILAIYRASHPKK